MYLDFDCQTYSCISTIFQSTYFQFVKFFKSVRVRILQMGLEGDCGSVHTYNIRTELLYVLILRTCILPVSAYSYRSDQ